MRHFGGHHPKVTTGGARSNISRTKDPPPMAKHDALKAQIETLRNAIPELKGVLVASTEGLPVAHSLSNGTDPNRVAAMAAAASSLGRRISDSLSTGSLNEVSIRSEEGMLFVYSAGKGVLAVMGPQGSNAGLIHLEARGTAD